MQDVGLAAALFGDLLVHFVEGLRRHLTELEGAGCNFQDIEVMEISGSKLDKIRAFNV